MTATQGPADRIEFWGFEFIHAVVGRPAERIGNRHSRCCYSDEAGGIDNGFSSALTPRSTYRTMALCLISRSVGGVIILGVKGDGDVRDFSPGSTSFYPVHREGGELIDFGFSGCQHQTAKIREVRHRIGRCPQPLRSEEHTSELQSLMRISYAVVCLKQKNPYTNSRHIYYQSTY